MPITVNTPWGQPAIFPDGTPDDEMQSALDGFAMEQQGRQRFQALPAIAQAAQQAFADVSGYQPYEIPVVPGNSFGLSSQQMQQTQNTIQQTQQMNAGEAIRQRAERDKALEAEKDRARQFQLEQMRFKNEADMRQFEADQAFERARWSADQDASQPIFIPGLGLYNPKTKEIMQNTQVPEKPVRPMALGAGQSLVDPVTGQTIVSMPAAAKEPRQPRSLGTHTVYNEETKKEEIRSYFDDGTYVVLGSPAPKDARPMSPQDLRAIDQAVADRVYEEGLSLGVYTPDGNIVPGMEGIASDLTAKHRAGVQAELGRGASPQSASAPEPQDEDTLENLLITDIPITGAPATPASPVAPPVDWADPDAIWKAVAPYVAPAPPPQPAMPQFPPLLGQNNVLYR